MRLFLHMRSADGLARLSPPSLGAASGGLPADSFASSASGVVPAAFLASAILAPGSRHAPRSMNARGHRIALGHGAHPAGAPYAGRVGRKLGGALHDRGRAAPCPRRDGGVGGRLSPADRRASIQWPLMLFALVPRQYMPGGSMIIPGVPGRAGLQRLRKPAAARAAHVR